MGKNSKYPSYTNGSVSVNGNTVSTNAKKGDTVSSNYNMPDAEKGIYDYAQSSFLSALPQINVFSPETKNEINSQLEAYKKQGMQTINNTYNPLLHNLKTDIASRFGNLNNSVFFDNLNSIENNRANAMSNLAQNIEAQRSELYNNELANRYNYLNFLNTLQNQINNNALNYMGIAQNNATLGNSYNQNSYSSTLNSANNAYDNLINTLATILQYKRYW